MMRSTLVFAALLTLAGACEQASANGTHTEGKAVNGAIAITVDGSGYHPGSVRAPANKLVKLVFTRTSDDGCGQQLVLSALNIRRDLPLNQPVTVEITMPASGNIAFTCGMNMYRGSVVAE